MIGNKDIKLQINEYHKLLEELRVEKIELPEQFVLGLLIEKLPDSWNDYKQQLKHKHKQLSMVNLITHIIIEYTNRKEKKATKAKQMTTKANLVQTDLKRYKHKAQNSDNKSKISNPHTLKIKALVMFVANQAIMHSSLKRQKN